MTTDLLILGEDLTGLIAGLEAARLGRSVHLFIPPDLEQAPGSYWIAAGSSGGLLGGYLDGLEGGLVPSRQEDPLGQVIWRTPEGDHHLDLWASLDRMGAECAREFPEGARDSLPTPFSLALRASLQRGNRLLDRLYRKWGPPSTGGKRRPPRAGDVPPLPPCPALFLRSAGILMSPLNLDPGDGAEALCMVLALLHRGGGSVERRTVHQALLRALRGAGGVVEPLPPLCHLRPSRAEVRCVHEGASTAARSALVAGPTPPLGRLVAPSRRLAHVLRRWADMGQWAPLRRQVWEVPAEELPVGLRSQLVWVEGGATPEAQPAGVLRVEEHPPRATLTWQGHGDGLNALRTLLPFRASMPEGQLPVGGGEPDRLSLRRLGAWVRATRPALPCRIVRRIHQAGAETFPLAGTDGFLLAARRALRSLGIDPAPLIESG